MNRAELDTVIAKGLARALVAELRAEMARTDESPATVVTVQGSENRIATEHEQRTPTTA